MTLDGGGGGEYHDLTPGKYGVDDKVEVKVDSLGEFGRGLLMESQSVFGGSMGPPIGFLKQDYGKEMGSRAIGNSEVFHETVTVANYLDGASIAAERLSHDLLYGHRALANVAMVMAEKYGVTDGFNAARTADAVNGAFAPPANSGKTLASEWTSKWNERVEQNRLRTLPVVDPSDVKFWNMSGKKEGVDYTIAPSAPPRNPNDPLQDGDVTNGEDTTPAEQQNKDKPPNEYYVIPEEDDYDPTRTPYQPPPPPKPDDGTVTLAPGAGPGGSSTSSSGTTTV